MGVVNYDGINIDDLVTADYIQQRGLARFENIGKLYDLKFEPTISAQDLGVINNGVGDTSNVFRVIAPLGSTTSPNVSVEDVKQLNRDGKVFFVRSPEFVLDPAELFYFNINVPANKKLTLVERFVIGRGLGSLDIEFLSGTNAITTPLPIGVVNTGANPGDIASTFAAGQVSIGGTPSPLANSIQYLGDETATTALRTEVSSVLPVTFFERIFDGSAGAINIGFSFTLRNVVNSKYSGYVEVYFIEEDI